MLEQTNGKGLYFETTYDSGMVNKGFGENKLEKVVCPYCGTATTQNKNTKRMTCECRRLHEYKDLNGGRYFVLYKKDRTKEVIKANDPEFDATLPSCNEIMRRYELMRYNHFKDKYETRS